MRTTLLTTIAIALLTGFAPGCVEENRKDEQAPTAPTGASAPALSHQAELPDRVEANRTEEPEPAPIPPLVAAARSQIGTTVVYDGAYVGLDYPNGDVPIERGVCTDVVIRALREAHDMDLQQLVHEDMKANFSRYPTIWGLTRPDKNIDHRRVPNLQTYFERQGYTVNTPDQNTSYEPGDLVTCLVGNRPHIMIVSDRQIASGTPLVIHNIGQGTQEEDRLHAFTITGHYRIPGP